MNNLSNTIGGYNRELESIGTEISYSATSDAPNEKNETLIKQQGGNTHRQVGGFLDYIFGQEDEYAELKRKGHEISRLLIDALSEKNYEASDFLMKQKFVPDLNIVNKHGENLLHLLVKAKDKTVHSGTVLLQIIGNKANVEYLNKQDNEGNTPLHGAVARGFNDIAEYMISLGAKRIPNKSNQVIMTEHDDEDSVFDTTVFRVPTKTEVVVEKTPSIFSRQQLPDVSRDDRISDIVKAFRTRYSPTETERLDIVRTDGDYNVDEKLDRLKTLLLNPVYEPIQKVLRDRTPSDGTRVSQAQVQTPSASRLAPIFVPTPVAKVTPVVPTGPAVSQVVQAPELNSDVPTEDFVRTLAQKIVGEQEEENRVSTINPTFSNLAIQAPAEEQRGGRGNVTKKITTKGKDNTRVVDKRAMLGFSEYNEYTDMFGGMSDDEMRRISRAASNQKEKFHEEAVEKILSHLPKKDALLARAVKAIIYESIKKSKPNLSGLDRAAELLKAITKENIEDALKQKELIKHIVDHLEAKQTERESKKSEEKTKKTSSKPAKVESGRREIDFESSLVESSDYETTDDSDSSSSPDSPQTRKISRRRRYVDL